MKTRLKTIEIEEAYAELTRDQLVALRTAMRGGNATEDNVQLMKHAALLLADHPSIASALRERAVFIESAIKQIEDLIWPPRSPQASEEASNG